MRVCTHAKILIHDIFYAEIYNVCMHRKKIIAIIYMKLEGVEPPTFGSGIRRAANCAIASCAYKHFLVRESNPGRQGENLVS